MAPRGTLLVATVWVWLSVGLAEGGVNYEAEPIRYSESEPNNTVSRLQKRLESGEFTLRWDDDRGYLPSLLDELRVPVSSQVLTFSKTSLQDDKISPSAPRAIYFNDETHVGFVRGGLIEIAVADTSLGMVFYTLDNRATEQPGLRRMTNNCLTCHGAARTRNVPGLLVRSVFTTRDGHPVIAAGSTLTTTSSPIAKRWGGWYVTGTHGTGTHLGNFMLSEAKKPKTIDNSAGLNVTDLSSRVDTSKYLAPHSDIVALMVLEHQADTYNALTQAGFEVRAALHKRTAGGGDQAEAEFSAAVTKAATSAAKALLFADEAPLEAPIRGASAFAEEFAKGPTEIPRESSLRNFDLQSRLFQHRCSYLIDSPNYKALPVELRREISRQIRDVLGPSKAPPPWLRGTPDERKTLLELLETSGRLEG